MTEPCGTLVVEEEGPEPPDIPGSGPTDCGTLIGDNYALMQSIAIDGRITTDALRDAINQWRSDKITEDTLRLVINAWREDCTLAAAFGVSGLNLSQRDGRITASVDVSRPQGSTAEVVVSLSKDGQVVAQNSTTDNEVAIEYTPTTTGEVNICADVVEVRV